MRVIASTPPTELRHTAEVRDDFKLARDPQQRSDGWSSVRRDRHIVYLTGYYIYATSVCVCVFWFELTHNNLRNGIACTLQIRSDHGEREKENKKLNACRRLPFNMAGLIILKIMLTNNIIHKLNLMFLLSTFEALRLHISYLKYWPFLEITFHDLFGSIRIRWR